MIYFRKVSNLQIFYYRSNLLEESDPIFFWSSSLLEQDYLKSHAENRSYVCTNELLYTHSVHLCLDISLIYQFNRLV